MCDIVKMDFIIYYENLQRTSKKDTNHRFSKTHKTTIDKINLSKKNHRRKSETKFNLHREEVLLCKLARTQKITLESAIRKIEMGLE